MADARPRRRRVCFPFFRDYSSVSLLAGAVFGFAVMEESFQLQLPYLLGLILAIFGGPVPAVLLIPGIVRRSLLRILIGLVAGGFLVLLLPNVFLGYLLPGGSLFVPGDQLFMSWTPGMVDFGSARHTFLGTGFALLLGFILTLAILLPIDICLLLLRGDGFRNRGRLKVAIFVSSIPVFVLYPFANIGDWPDWFQVSPLGFTHTASAELTSALAFWLIFPAKYALLNWLYEPEVFLAPYGGGGRGEGERGRSRLRCEHSRQSNSNSAVALP
jgi:uncharacterized membrane protein (UPF0136 family)